MACLTVRCAVFDFFISSLTIAGIYGLMALGLNLQAGYSGLLNFGHIAFAGIGAYATGITIAAGGPPLLGAAIGIALAMLLGLAVARLGRQLGADGRYIVGEALKLSGA